MDAPHWRIRTVRGLSLFFDAVVALGPEESFLVLAGGFPPERVGAELSASRSEPASPPVLWREFTSGACVAITPETMTAMRRLADCHAAPRIAMHYS